MEYHHWTAAHESFRRHGILAIIAVFRFLLLLSLIVYFAVMFNEWADNQWRIYLDIGHRGLRRLIIVILMSLGVFERLGLFVEGLSSHHRVLGVWSPPRLATTTLFQEQSIYRRLISVLGWMTLLLIAVMLAFFYVPSFSDWAAGILGGDKTVIKYILYGFGWIWAPLGAFATIMWAAERVSRFIREDDINVIGSDNG